MAPGPKCPTDYYDVASVNSSREGAYPGRAEQEWELDDQQAGEHQAAAGEVARAETFVEHHVAGQGGEDRFQAHHDRRVGGGRGSLADDLEREGDPRREDAAVEDGDRGRHGSRAGRSVRTGPPPAG